MLAEVHHISVGITRNWRALYADARQAEHFPEWASGLGSELRRDDEDWIVAALRIEARVRPAAIRLHHRPV